MCAVQEPDSGCWSPVEEELMVIVKRKITFIESWDSPKGLEAYAAEGMCTLFIRCRQGGESDLCVCVGGDGAGIKLNNID